MKELHKYLIDQPLARERKNKDKAIANILIQKHKLTIDRDLLATVLKEFNSLDREWRQILEKNEDLRGKDYWDKEKLINIKRKGLGYN
jgi:hypothetical protein